MKKVLQTLFASAVILFVLTGCSPLATSKKAKPDGGKTPTSHEVTPAAVLNAVPLSFKDYESAGSAGSARNAAPTPDLGTVPLGSSVPVVIDSRAVSDIDGKNDNSKIAKMFLMVLKNDVSKLPGFEFGKNKTIGYLETLSPETRAYFTETGNDVDEFLEVADWGTVNVTMADDKVVIYWSFKDNQVQYVMCICGTYNGESYSELEMMFSNPLLTYYEKYYIDNGKPAELVAYIISFGPFTMTSFNRIERTEDAYVSYFVNKEGDTYIPTEIGFMDSTGGFVFMPADESDEENQIDSYWFIDKDCAVMEKMEYLRNEKLYQEHFATRYLELISGHTLEYREDNSGGESYVYMYLDNEFISYENSTTDDWETWYTTIFLGQQSALLPADLAGTKATGKLRFTKHDQVHNLKAKADALCAAADNPALYTGLDEGYIVSLRDEPFVWSASLN